MKRKGLGERKDWSGNGARGEKLLSINMSLERGTDGVGIHKEAGRALGMVFSGP